MTEQVNLPWSYVFVLVWRDGQAWLTRLDWMTVFGAVLIVGTIAIFLRLSRGGSRFNFADAFAGENGVTSMAKLTAWVGSLTSSWIMVALTIAGKMTENYILTYLGILVLGKVGTEAVGVFRQAQIARTVEARGGGPDPDPPPQQVGTVKMDVPLMAQPPATQPNTTVSRRPLGKRDA